MYEFTCRKCGQVFEELLAFSDLAKTELSCPACNSTKVDKGVSGFATNSGDSSGGGFPAPGGCSGGGGFT